MCPRQQKLWLLLFLLAKERIAGFQLVDSGHGPEQIRGRHTSCFTQRPAVDTRISMVSSTLSESNNSNNTTMEMPITGVFRSNDLPSQQTLVPSTTWQPVAMERDTPTTAPFNLQKQQPTPRQHSRSPSAVAMSLPSPPQEPGQVIYNFASRGEFLDALDNNNNNQNDLLIVLYHAHYCRLCQRSSITYRKVAHEYSSSGSTTTTTRPLKHNTTATATASSTTPTTMHFTRLEASTWSGDELRSLGLTKFPFMQIYRQGDCVASFSTGPSHLFTRRVRDTLEACRQRSNAEWTVLSTQQYAMEIAANHQARRALREKWNV